MIGMRPCECCTAMRISSLCSSKSTVGDSPVVPTTTMPSVPSDTCQSISLRNAARSRAPSSFIGVTMATRLPVIMAPILFQFDLLGSAPQSAKPLNDRRFRPFHPSLLEARDGELAKRLQQLARLQQELRIGRPAEFFVPRHEGLVDEHPSF